MKHPIRFVDCVVVTALSLMIVAGLVRAGCQLYAADIPAQVHSAQGHSTQR